MEYDKVLQYIGDFGPFQRRAAFFLVLGAVQTGMHIAVMTFIAAIPEHHCRVPEVGLTAYNATWPGNLNTTIPLEQVDGIWRLSSCTKYSQSSGDILSTNSSDSGCTEGHVQDTRTRVGCNRERDHDNMSITQCTDGWEYDRSQYHSSVVMQYDLVCERAWLRELAQSMFMAGVATGGFLFGVLSDRYGRHRTLLMCNLLLVTCGGGLAFTSNLIVFIALRFILGAAQNGLQYTTLVTGMETIGTSWRMAFGVCTALAPSIGYTILGILAYVIRDWQVLQIVVTSPGVVALACWWFIPESPRWLLSNNRIKEWRKTLQRIADFNRVDLPEKVLESIESCSSHADSSAPGDEKRKYNLVDLVRTPNMRKITLAAIISCWNVVCIYTGLLFGTSQLAGSHYVNFILSACVEAVAILSAGVTMRRWGRKRPTIAFSLLAGASCVATAAVPPMCLSIRRWGRKRPTIAFSLLAGASCVATAAVPPSLGHVTTALATVGRFGGSIAFAILDIYCTELFPTVVRHMGVGTTIMISRTGGIVAPFISLLGNVWRPLPLLMLGLLSCVTSLVVTVLPETHGVPLPNTLEDGENFGRIPPPSPTLKSSYASIPEDKEMYEVVDLVTSV